MRDDLRPGSRAYFDALLAEMKPYWDADSAYRARTISGMGVLNATTTLNQLGKEAARTTPPSLSEITAVEVTVWDNWAHTGGKRPSERKKEANYDKQRWKVEVEIFNAPEGSPIFGGGNAAPNSIYRGTAIAMEPDPLMKYVNDKREGKKIKTAWKDDPDLSIWADELDELATQRSDIHLGPLVWTANKRVFSRGMGVIVENIGTKQMRVTVLYPDGHHRFSRWTSKATGGREIKSADGNSTAVQCRASNRPDLTTWRTAKLG